MGKETGDITILIIWSSFFMIIVWGQSHHNFDDHYYDDALSSPFSSFLDHPSLKFTQKSRKKIRTGRKRREIRKIEASAWKGTEVTCYKKPKEGCFIKRVVITTTISIMIMIISNPKMKITRSIRFSEEGIAVIPTRQLFSDMSLHRLHPRLASKKSIGQIFILGIRKF